ncbi:MAG: hypothetical protein LBQ90_02510 [Synergistaceae bacterium]|jgi:hypothetical protein|nr:hypothetical protein [Synergistaceae bacterium]
MKNLYALAAAVFICMVPAFSSEAAPLPDMLGEWRATPLAVTGFETASRDLGQWQSRVYIRSAPPASIGVELMEGSGPGSLRVPGGAKGTVSQSDAPLGFASTYRTLNISGKSAILERGEVTGQALAIAFDRNRTLTVETKSVSEEELLDFAARLTTALEAERPR